MPTIQSNLFNEKKLDLSKYFKLDEGETEAFITIKKMDVTLKKKVQLLSWQKMSDKTSRDLIKQMELKGKTIEDIEHLKPDEAIDMVFNSNIDMESKKTIMDFTAETQKVIFENCIDAKNHNFFHDKEKTKKIKVNNYDFWNSYGNDVLIDFIYNQIKDFSDNFFFNPNGEQK